RKSATGSLTAMLRPPRPASTRARCAGAAWPLGSPARLHDTRDLARQRQLPEADAAQAEIAQESARTPAAMATGVGAHLELRLPLPLLHDRLLGHRVLL